MMLLPSLVAFWSFKPGSRHLFLAARVLALGVLVCVLLSSDLPAADEPSSPLASTPPAASAPEGQPAADDLENAAPVGIVTQLTKQGVRLWRQGDIESAERVFADALSRDVPVEEKRPLLLELAQLYEEDRKPLQVISVIERYLDEFPNEPDAPGLLMRLGLAYRETGAFSAATARFFQILNTTLRLSTDELERNQRYAMRARLEIADTFMTQGNFEEAQKYYTRLQVLDLEPRDRERVQFRSAQLAHALGEWQPAEQALGLFLAEYPESVYAAEARYLRAKSLDELRRKDEAVQEVLTLLRAQDSTDPEQRSTVAYWKRRTGNELANALYEQGDFLGALSIYQALAGANDDPEWRWPAVYQIGLCFERLSLGERAAEAYEVILAPDPALPAGRKISDTLASLQAMAKWRLAHLDWIEDFGRRLQVVSAGQPADA